MVFSDFLKIVEVARNTDHGDCDECKRENDRLAEYMARSYHEGFMNGQSSKTEKLGPDPDFVRRILQIP